jgi:DivIVA domain-containing protein
MPATSAGRITPEDISSVRFHKAPVGKRGYNEDEVDQFLDSVEAELARVLEENTALTRQLTQTRAQPAVPPPPPARAPVPAPRDEAGEVSRLMAMASDTAERYLAEAKADGEQIIAVAKANAERITAEARGKAQQVIAEATARAEATVADARRRSEAIEREAQERAAALRQEAETRYTEAMTALDEDRVAYEDRIEELQTFEEDYRTRLRAHLEGHLRELDSRTPAQPTTKQVTA